MRFCAIISFFLMFAFACDTSMNIKPPGRNYFLKYFGGDGNQTAVGLIVNNDGTFFILGNSRLTPDSLQKVYVAKADPYGNLLWGTTYGDAEMDARDFVLSNGALVVVANRSSSRGSADKRIQLIKFDPANGSPGINSILVFTQQPSANTVANSITVLSNGDFVISGNTNYTEPGHDHPQNALHFRTDNNFVRRVSSWLDIDGSGTVNNAVKAFEHSGTIYFFGSTNASNIYTDQNFWAFSLLSSSGAPNGNSDDKSEFVVGEGVSDEIVTNVQKTTFGYLMTGVSIDINSQAQTLDVIKLGNDSLSFSTNDIQLRYTGRALGKGNVPFATAYPSVAGSYLVLTNVYNQAGNSDMQLIKLHSDYASGELVESWSDPTLIGGDGDDTSAAVAELPDGRIIMLGTMNLGKPAEQYKIVLMKLNSNGRLTD